MTIIFQIREVIPKFSSFMYKQKHAISFQCFRRPKLLTTSLHLPRVRFCPLVKYPAQGGGQADVLYICLLIRILL